MKPNRAISVLMQVRQMCSQSGRKSVRVRFAPSPTGMLHLGAIRTALYNYLFARKHNGQFILRIEDTDQSRIVGGAVEKMLELLNWANIAPDEGPIIGGQHGPYFQSLRLQLYQEKIKHLLEIGSAYHCFCSEKRLAILRRNAQQTGQIPQYDNKCRNLTPEEVEEKLCEKRPHVIRFKLKSKVTHVSDMIFEPCSVNFAEQESDPVLMKSDGYPTYHFANVVDDHLMNITHVFRGVEWQISTPKHIQLYEAFQWTPPQYGHLPLITNKDGKKFSKRDGSVNVENYKQNGYFPESLLNFVTETGGGFDGRKQGSIYGLEELVNMFDVTKLGRNSSRLDFCKLDEINQAWLRRKLENNTDVMLQRLQKLLSNQYPKFDVNRKEYLQTILHKLNYRIVRLEDLLEDNFAFLWHHTAIEKSKFLDIEPEAVLLIDDVIKLLKSFDEKNLKQTSLSKPLKDISNGRNVKFAQLMKLLRLAVSGLKEGPSVAEMITILGQKTSLERLLATKDALQCDKNS